ncbi:hypothetical protein FAZ69_23605 [Trinickia terrae]|uniref:Uncharacterized protein n=1 Tax=Trinickia terrae TaxID=2571161 RepID=A0A4U1HWX2_9BURK|nr:hypothetical protein [Trinickia terrae]TKC83476.1 hypothetical protein FAZ69_23605 [Trinickia terrae]
MSIDNPQNCVIVRWNAETQAVTFCTVDARKVQDVAAKAFNIDLPLDEFGGVVTDELARKLGAGMVNLLSLTNPDLKTLNKTTQAEE